MILSCITMLIDHIGFVFFSASPIWRMIGRLAMPIYAYFIATGYEHTSDIGKYIKRIALTAIVSQIPFMLLFNAKNLNMCFAWLFSLIILYGIDHKNYRVLALGVVTAVPVLLTISVDYSFYGICMPLLFYIRNKIDAVYKDILVFLGMILLTIPLGTVIQFVAVLAVPLIMIAEKLKKKRIENKGVKRCYQCFYPVHMVVLAVVRGTIAIAQSLTTQT